MFIIALRVLKPFIYCLVLGDNSIYITYNNIHYSYSILNNNKYYFHLSTVYDAHYNKWVSNQ